MSIAPADPHRREAGFTIAEALVALFVFALAGVALVQMQTQSVQTFGRVETRALARMVAENSLVEEMASASEPVLGAREGKAELGGKSWRWRLDIAPTADAGTYRIQAQAFVEGGDAPSASIVAFKIVGAR